MEVYFYVVFGIKIVVCSIFINVKGLMKVVICDNNFVFFFEYVLFYNFSEEFFEGDYICVFD